MSDLPTCRWRADADGGLYRCSSPNLIHAGPIAADFCQNTCPKRYIDAPALESVLRAGTRKPGAGFHLKRLLASHGINPNADGCQCNARAAEMDRNGPNWCEANIETIVGWMREEAERRGLPFVAFYARWLVRRAIKAAT